MILYILLMRFVYYSEFTYDFRRCFESEVRECNKMQVDTRKDTQEQCGYQEG